MYVYDKKNKLHFKLMNESDNKMLAVLAFGKVHFKSEGLYNKRHKHYDILCCPLSVKHFTVSAKLMAGHSRLWCCYLGGESA